MNALRLRRHSTIGVCALFLLVMTTSSGCQVYPFNGQINWFQRGRTQTTFVTPAQRIEQLQDVAKDAKGATQQEAEQMVAQFSQQLSSESDPLIREQLVRTVEAFPIPQSVFVLESGLADNSAMVRIACCEALAKLQYSEAQAALLETMVKDSDLDVRLAAIEGLGSFGERGSAKAISALSTALDDLNPAIQNEAMDSLRQITGADIGANVDAWRMYVRGETPPPPQPVSMAQRLRGMTPF